MTEEKPRRPRGEGTIWWDEDRKRWIAQRTVGYDARGRRIKRKATGTSQTAAIRNLRQRVKAYEAGLSTDSERYTVEDVVTEWLDSGLSDADEATIRKYRDLSSIHVIPHLGGRRLRDLRATEVDAWLKSLRTELSTDSLRMVRSCLNRAVREAMVRGYVDRNVVEVTRTPRGKEGRPSKALTLEQTHALLTRTVDDPLHCYIAVSVLTGARTEELRALRWEHVHLDGKPDATPPVPPYVEVWRSVRKTGDTKTHKSRRTLALPALAVEKLRDHRLAQDRQRAKARAWNDNGLVFTTEVGTEMDAANVRRGFRRALHLVPGIDPDDWTPREMRHTFVSLLSDSGMPIDEIAKLVGHAGGSTVTERVYRKQLRPVIQTGATAMDVLFSDDRRPGEDDD